MALAFFRHCPLVTDDGLTSLVHQRAVESAVGHRSVSVSVLSVRVRRSRLTLPRRSLTLTVTLRSRLTLVVVVVATRSQQIIPSPAPVAHERERGVQQHRRRVLQRLLIAPSSSPSPIEAALEG